VNLRLPPLRERPGDVIAMAEFFIKSTPPPTAWPRSRSARKARRRLAAHRWPGNVRELENAMHRAVLLSIGAEIDENAIRLPDGQPLAPGRRAYAHRPGRLRRRRDRHPRLRGPDGLGDGAATDHRDPGALLRQPHPRGQHPGISIRTLRNKLKEYTEAGVPVPAPQWARARPDP
jgi:DNA-binding NtrC family response regulator